MRADSLYGESHEFVRLLDQLNLPWIVAIRKQCQRGKIPPLNMRSNHGVWMPENEEPEYSDWQCNEANLLEWQNGGTLHPLKQSLVGAYSGEERTLTNDRVTLPDNGCN